MMVGEIRDAQAAKIAMRAAITGHRVLSTLHTSDAIATVDRLSDMGVKPFMIAAAIRGIVSQRLLRRVCTGCGGWRAMTDKEAEWVSNISGSEVSENEIYRGRGCNRCDHTGYDGRIGVFEFIDVTESMREQIRTGSMSEFARLARVSISYKPMPEAALEYVKLGVTNIAEVIRVFGDHKET